MGVSLPVDNFGFHARLLLLSKIVGKKKKKKKQKKKEQKKKHPCDNHFTFTLK